MKRLVVLALFVAACAPAEPAEAPPRPLARRALSPLGSAPKPTPSSATPTAPIDHELPIDRTIPKAIAATRNFRNGRPTKVWVTSDGSTAFFLRSESRDANQALFKLDVQSGDERKLADAESILKEPEKITPEEKARRERLRQTATGITSYEVTKN